MQKNMIKMALVALVVVVAIGPASMAAESGNDAAVHAHGQCDDGQCATTEVQEHAGNEFGCYGWRYVTHSWCGHTGYYYVQLNVNNYIICQHCGYGLWAYVW